MVSNYLADPKFHSNSTTGSFIMFCNITMKAKE